MLVDATHPEETRIVVTQGNRLEEFDFESASRKQLRGNIYLAKITRVEPSLQAAFVEYGGNRHGFLAFSEIHPDYYQIPTADKEALLEAEKLDDNEISEPETPSKDSEEQLSDNSQTNNDDLGDDENEDLGENIEQSAPDDLSVEQIGGVDPLDEEVVEKKKEPQKRYKIQEVIKRRQVLLVQVVKEERGNKGAALTTYLSLAGRYSVLMPNTAKGGGISRKITNAGDRKRLKEVAQALEVPSGMGVILRTAGASRTKAEINRDFDYLMRLWESVRTLTLNTSAPSLVYEEGSLIKRTIRDLYDKEITELYVSGEQAHEEAKEFMHMIMPSHAKNVKQYKDSQPIFSKYNVETQLDSMFSSQVTLPSGGYIVIDPTEALVSIDVNSGKATKERNIEATALQTNLEAAEEVARQLRLRDMAGLVVIDFIDMMEKSSIRKVERKLKDSLQHDRARIQVGRISHFGLLEMSRQRMRFGVLESSTNVCPTCSGAGIVRSVESMALMVMRAIEDHIQRKSDFSINVLTPTQTAFFLLNSKRESLSELEAKHGISISISADDTLNGSGFQIEKGEKRKNNRSIQKHVSISSAQMTDIETDEDETDVKTEDKTNSKSRRRRGGRNRNQKQVAQDNAEKASDSDNVTKEITPAVVDGNTEVNEGDEDQPKRRRRGRRGGKRNKRNPNEVENNETTQDSVVQDDKQEEQKPAGYENEKKATTKSLDKKDKNEKPKRRTRRPRNKPLETEQPQAEQPIAKPDAPKSSTTEAVKEEKPKTKPKAKTKPKPKTALKKADTSDDKIVVTSSKPEEKAEKQPKKGGWWQKGGFFG